MSTKQAAAQSLDPLFVAQSLLRRRKFTQCTVRFACFFSQAVFVCCNSAANGRKHARNCATSCCSRTRLIRYLCGSSSKGKPRHTHRHAQAAWLIKTQALTGDVASDAAELEAEGLAELALEDNGAAASITSTRIDMPMYMHTGLANTMLVVQGPGRASSAR